MSEITPELKTYNGNCHCGAFKFTIKVPEITTVTQCNCSICFKKGYRWVFPAESCFEITKGEGTLKEYHFGQRTMVHRFCPTCGSNVQGFRYNTPAGRDVGINVNCLQDMDQWSLKVNEYDGLGREPQYVAPKYTGELPSVKFENEKLYTGGCHCDAVTIAFKTQAPLSKRHEHIQECNCSICCRLGITVCYATRDQVSISGISNLTEYSFGQGYNIFRFCSICGITVDVEKDMAAVSRSPKTWESLTPAQRERWPTIHAINLRCLEGVEWDVINIYKANTRAIDPQYVVPE
ncbi:uncharacterized protein EAE97_008994 [Botrytis byssoidea]|uniref:CENP-V/GFA domain-containing protein n=1 Tax=Botrytis byssoidea TaxID=139641 RepID=A0A9P5I4W2_9HELO|nr:uncharacterized protein EAE97_008994 [Botrytis byssoidea]KAF7931973.1 hypothetical protein EAE97_008994 [Botrytis byssoidea]